MTASPFKFMYPVAAVVLAIVLCACSSREFRPAEPVPDDSIRVSYAGFWELNLGQSDNIQARLDTLVRELVRRAERQAQGRPDRGGGMPVGNVGSNTVPSIVGLARMADLVTQSQLLEIEQGKNTVLVKRENNFALTCEFFKETFQPHETLLGTELCGWDSHQLLFRIYLPQGLSIQHRLSLGSSGDRLNIATTVHSDQVSYPFTLNRVYDRYDPDTGGINCEMTLTRGKVCTTEAR